MKLLVYVLALAFCLSCARTQKPKSSSAVCFLEFPSQVTEAAEGDEKRIVLQEPTTEQWFSLLLHAYETKRSEVVGPPLDCTGTPLTWQTLEDGCQQRAESPQPQEKLTPSSLLLNPMQKGRRLAWVQVQRFLSGEALGPVALVEQTAEGLEVRAIGSLRSNPDRARLRLEPVSSVELLVAEGEVCHRGSSTCRRAIRIMPLRGSRFINETLTTEGGQCVGPAWFPMEREEEAQLSSGWRRSIRLATTVEFQSDQVVVHEQMVVQDSDPRKPSEPARLFRKAQTDRIIRVGPNQLIVDVPSLWSRIADFKR